MSKFPCRTFLRFAYRCFTLMCQNMWLISSLGTGVASHVSSIWLRRPHIDGMWLDGWLKSGLWLPVATKIYLVFFCQSYHTVGIIFSVPYKTPTSSDSLDCEELLLDMSHGRSQAQVELVYAYIFSLISLNHYNAKFVTRIVFSF